MGREDVQFKVCCEPRWGPDTYGTVIIYSEIPLQILRFKMSSVDTNSTQSALSKFGLYQSNVCTGLNESDFISD